VTELELQLRALSGEIDFPPAPDLRARVRAGLGERRSRRPFLPRRALVIALAALAVAIGAAFAVPPARTAILEWLGLRGVEIRRVAEPPTVPTTPTTPGAAVGADLGPGVHVTLAEAKRRASFRVVVPTLDSLPAPEVYFASSLPGGQVALVYGPAGNRLLLTQFQATPGFPYIQKSVGPGTKVESVTVDGQLGFWLTGDPHELFYEDPTGVVRDETIRLAGNVLLWERGTVTLRLEGADTKAEALRIARSVA
jgi:hypothetical protein